MQSQPKFLVPSQSTLARFARHRTNQRPATGATSTFYSLYTAVAAHDLLLTRYGDDAPMNPLDDLGTERQGELAKGLGVGEPCAPPRG